MPNLSEIIEMAGAQRSWTVASPKVVKGFLWCKNNLGEEKPMGLAWLAKMKAEGSLSEQPDGSFIFQKSEMPTAVDFN